MSKKEPIKIEIEKTLNIDPGDIYTAKVVSSGNGAIIKSFKRYIGKDVVVIMANKINTKKKTEEEKNQEFKDLMENAGEEGWKDP